MTLAESRGATPDGARTVAAVDLGSNSFHLIVAEATEDRLVVVDRLKEMVRLAAGLDASNHLHPSVATRALECLARFGQRLRDIPPEQVRVVGTNTLRKARNGTNFVARAQQTLGHEIEIISGREEARLIYLGVSHSVEDHAERRLVVDIGGGSTELIIGCKFQPEQLESLYMGCVELSNRFFPDGVISEDAMHAAELFALQELEPIVERFKAGQWETAIGASGTIQAVQEVLRAAGWSRSGICTDGLSHLRRHLVLVGEVSRLELEGLPQQRAPVFPGGVAILGAVFRALGVQNMQVSSGALREGLLYDLLGRHERTDVREQTVRALVDRYRLDQDQAGRVRTMALDLLDAAAEPWNLDVRELAPLLRWAAALHEVGTAIAHSQYHKHGGYLLGHMDMPGFSRTHQHKLALLVRAHRRKFPSAEFADQPIDDEESLRRAALLLRCAVCMHRSRSIAQIPAISGIEADEAGLHIIFPESWLNEHPLTRLDLAEESAIWRSQGLELSFSDVDQMQPPALLAELHGK